MSEVNELVVDGFYRACEKHSERTALIYLGEKITYPRAERIHPQVRHGSA